MAEVLEPHDRPELKLLRAKIWGWLFFPASCNLIVNNPLRSFVILSEAQRSRRISTTRYASLACPELAVALSEKKLALSAAEWVEGVVEWEGSALTTTRI